jgi:8-oxo-dGTP diphosphatase
MNVRVDVVIFSLRDSAVRVLLTRRSSRPFKGRMSLPGRRVSEGESLERTVQRELEERVGKGQAYVEQLYSFGELRRDPRGRVITVAYYALIPGDRRVRHGRDSSAALWFPVDKLPPLAFDHAKILAYGRERLRNKLEYTTVGFQLLPGRFTLSELQRLYEAVLGKKLDKRNFRKKMGLLGILRPLRDWRRTGRKPARLYAFIPKKFEKLKDKGILFPF